MPQPPTYLKRGDTLPTFSAILREANGDAVDLQIGDTAALYMRETATSRALKINGGGMTIVSAGAPLGDPDRGRVTYDWLPADTDTPGHYDLEVRVTRAGADRTFPSNGYHRVIVLDEIA